MVTRNQLLIFQYGTRKISTTPVIHFLNRLYLNSSPIWTDGTVLCSGDRSNGLHFYSGQLTKPIVEVATDVATDHKGNYGDRTLPQTQRLHLPASICRSCCLSRACALHLRPMAGLSAAPWTTEAVDRSCHIRKCCGVRKLVAELLHNSLRSHVRSFFICFSYHIIKLLFVQLWFFDVGLSSFNISQAQS